MSERLIKKAVFEIDKLLQDTVEITARLEANAERATSSQDLNDARKLIKIYTEAHDWCLAIIGR